jgi:hypothetical protein
MKQLDEAKFESGTTTTMPRAEEKLPEVGEWYWIDEGAIARLNTDGEDDGEDEAIDINVDGLALEIDGAPDDEEDEPEEPEEEPVRWLGAVTFVGTNYASVQGYTGDKWGSSRNRRLHFDIFDDVCTLEPNADEIIAGNAARHSANARDLMAEVMELTRRLGVAPRAEIGDGGTGETQALALRGSNESIVAYKKSLIKAQKEDMPALFKRIEQQNKIAASWMTAQLIPMMAKAEALKPLITAIENRIFSVELYAGLIEEVVQFADGEPAPNSTPITLMQRRHYMDEESLAQYEAGGMDYKSIEDFDKWMARKENRDRILPTPRCIVAFRVRRYDKEREGASIADFIRIFHEQEADRQTFLYIRNGERLFRLSTGIDFGEELFPDMDRLDTTQALYIKQDRDRDSDFIITEGRYLMLLAEDEAHEASKRKVKYTYKGGKKENIDICSCNEKELKREPLPPGPWFWCNYRSKAVDYEMYTDESVYYDDATEHIAEEQARHNRLVLVLQGLLDRSPVMHPHPQWRLWTPEGFSVALTLIYDSKRAITPGEAPDFEAYRARLNASLKVGSITVGQEVAWEEREAVRENARQARDWRIRSKSYYKRFRPHNNPGPGRFASVAAISKQGVTYRWTRKKLTGRKVWVPNPNRPGWGHDEIVYDDIQDSITTPHERVLNIDAYTPGDFKVFFNDPRIRAMYLKWAPLLLSAEDYLGKKKRTRNA